MDDQDPDRMLQQAEKSLQEEIRRIKAPDLDTVKAFKNISKRNFVDIDFGKIKGRYSSNVLPDNAQVLASMTYQGQKID